MATFAKFVDMAKTPEEISEDMAGSPYAIPMKDIQKYPFGLSICLCEDELEKLDLDHGDCEPGDYLHLHALARVTSVSSTETEDGNRCRIELTMTHIAVENENDENDEADEELDQESDDEEE